MPGIEQINIGNSLRRRNIKKILGYAVKNRNGYYKDIKRVDEKRGVVVNSFEMTGFIHTGNTLKEKTYSITDLGDQYYKDVFGRYSYWGKRLSGALSRLKEKLFNKGEI